MAYFTGKSPKFWVPHPLSHGSSVFSILIPELLLVPAHSDLEQLAMPSLARMGGGTTDEVERLAWKILSKLNSLISRGDLIDKSCTELKESRSNEQRVIIGISGVPGSGKSTLAKMVCESVNALHGNHDPERTRHIAVAVPMDGFHLSRAQLAAMPDAAMAIHRRGAAFTFDAAGFYHLVQQLAKSPVQAVSAPSFDHATKDPVAGAIDIPETARVVLIEGNYCALNRAPWSDAAKLMDELWYIDVPADVAQSRLAIRHLQSGIVADENEAWERAAGTDELNAEDVRENRLHCHERLVLM